MCTHTRICFLQDFLRVLFCRVPLLSIAVALAHTLCILVFRFSLCNFMYLQYRGIIP